MNYITKLQNQTIESYNDIVNYLNENKPDENGCCYLEATKAYHLFRKHHNNLVFLTGLPDPISQKSIFDGIDVGFVIGLNWIDRE